MSASKNPLDEAVEQALNAFVYAPIGLLYDGPGRFPELVQNGKNQVSTARMMGQFAVQAGSAELQKRAKQTDGPLRDVLQGLGVVPRAPRPNPDPMPAPAKKSPAAAEPKADDTAAKASTAETAPAKTPAKKPAAKKAAAKKASAKKTTAKKSSAKKSSAEKAPTGTADELAIPGYDTLSASQVTSRLSGLAEIDLLAIEAHEIAGRGRKTILGKIDKLLDR